MRRALWLIGATVLWTAFACSGTLGDYPEGDTDEGWQEEAPGKGRKKPKKRRRPKPGADTPADGDEGAGDGDAGGGGGGDAGGGGGGGGGGGEHGGGDHGGGGGASPSPSPSPAPGPAPSAPAGISDLGGNTWQIKRSLVNKWEDNPNRLGNASKKSQGYKLSGIGNASDAFFIGLKNGDVVTKINGYSLASTAEALMAYAAVKNENNLNVKIKRGSSTITHKYKIVN